MATGHLDIWYADNFFSGEIVYLFFDAPYNVNKKLLFDHLLIYLKRKYLSTGGAYSAPNVLPILSL